MSGEINEQVPQGGSRLLTVFGLPGAAIGLLAWGALQWLDGTGSPVAMAQALLALLVFGGLAYALLVLRGQIVRSALTALALGAVTALLLYIASDQQIAAITDGALPWLASLGIVGVALPFLRALSRGHGLTDYPPLHADAWNIPAIVAIAQLFVLCGAALAALIAALFAFIGFPVLRELMTEGWFVGTYCGLLQGVGIGVVRQRETSVLAARGILMALLRVSAPVFAFCVTVFVLAILLRGFGGLLGGLSPLATLTAAATVSIIMINAIVGERGRPENALFGGTARLLGLLLLFLMSLAVYGLYLRVAAEGWTPNRILAGVFVTLAALYAPTYAAAALAERWAILRQGNIALSALLLAIAVFVQTPAFRPYDWSVRSQVEILMAEPEAATTEDLAYLRDRLGEPGREAFDAFAAGEGRLADLAAQAPASPLLTPSPLTAEGAEAMQADDRLLVLPAGSTLSPETVEAFSWHLGTAEQAVFLLGAEEGAIWALIRSSYALNIYRSAPDGEAVPMTMYSAPLTETEEAMFEAARRGELTLEERVYRVPVLEGRVLLPRGELLGSYEVREMPEEAPLLGEPRETPGD